MYLTFVEVQHSHPTYHGRLLSPQSSPCRGTGEPRLRMSPQSQSFGTAGCEESWARQEGHVHCCCLSSVGKQCSGRSVNKREPSWTQLNMNWKGGLQIFLV